jgi:hypothetical protein
MSAETPHIRRLNWGCGDVAKAEWVNSYQGDYPGVDLVYDIRDGLPFASESNDYAISSTRSPRSRTGRLFLSSRSCGGC